MGKILFNWSGGKDSSLALHEVLKHTAREDIILFTSVNKSYGRISMHGVRMQLLHAQAESLGIRLETLLLPEAPNMMQYNQLMQERLQDLVEEEEIETAVFGDIFLQDLREYREQQLAKVGIKGEFPIWKRDTTDLIHSFIDLGFRAALVCINERFLGENFAGREIDSSFLQDLPDGVDPCGENGEYHSYVYAGPIFQHSIDFTKGETVRRTYQVQEQSDEEEGDVCSLSDKNYDTGFFYTDLLPVLSS
ncbi:MAG: diphthine--ammonia ligase [Spirochaetota bacterium]